MQILITAVITALATVVTSKALEKVEGDVGVVKKNLIAIILANSALLICSSIMPLKASVLVSYDWNDGTTQGWGSAPRAFNDSNRLRFTNPSTAALQAFSPFLPLGSSDVLPEILEFDLEFTFYEVISNLEELTTARVSFVRSNPRLSAANATIIGYDLDLSGLAFNETRSFSISLEDPDTIERCCISNPFPGFPSVEDTLKAPDNIDFFFAVRDNGTIIQAPASALLDNFIVKTTKPKIPEPSLLLGLMLIGTLTTANKIYKDRN